MTERASYRVLLMSSLLSVAFSSVLRVIVVSHVEHRPDTDFLKAKPGAWGHALWRGVARELGMNSSLPIVGNQLPEELDDLNQSAITGILASYLREYNSTIGADYSRNEEYPDNGWVRPFKHTCVK